VVPNRAEHSTKVIEFSEISDYKSLDGPVDFHIQELRKKGLAYEKRIRQQRMVSSDLLEEAGEEDEAAFGMRFSLLGASISVVDNGNSNTHGREILLVSLEKINASFSESREGYHEFELRLMALQIDNFVQKSIHPVLVRFPVNTQNAVIHFSHFLFESI
jgi:hypothetical protein